MPLSAFRLLLLFLLRTFVFLGIRGLSFFLFWTTFLPVSCPNTFLLFFFALPPVAPVVPVPPVTPVAEPVGPCARRRMPLFAAGPCNRAPSEPVFLMPFAATTAISATSKESCKPRKFIMAGVCMSKREIYRSPNHESVERTPLFPSRNLFANRTNDGRTVYGGKRYRLH